MLTRSICTTGLIFAVIVIFLSPALQADVITLLDGRYIEGKIEQSGDVYKVHLNHGTVAIAASQVRNVLLDADGKQSPKQKKERERIEKVIEDLKTHSNWRHAYEEKSKHFEFKYNVTPEIAKGYIDLLEGIYKDFTKQLKVKLGPGHRRDKPLICIFRDAEQFQQVGGVGGGVLGYWNFVEEKLCFYHDRNDPEFTVKVLLHEFTHLLTHLIEPKFNHPIWCNEGIAEYFGATSVEEGKLVYGGMLENRVVSMNAWRAKDNDYHLEELMRVSRGAFSGIEYGWAWSFVRFCMSSKKYNKKFIKFYVGLAKDTRVDRGDVSGYYYPSVKPSDMVDYFKKTFGTRDLDKLNEEWHAYIDESLRVSSGKGYLQEAKIQWMENKDKEALESIKTAEEEWDGDESPLLYYTKGRILMDLDKYALAKEAFAKAAELDAINGRYYYYLGDAFEEMYDDDETEELLKEAIRLKELARELAPDDYNLRYWVERDAQLRKERKGPKDGEATGKRRVRDG